MLNLTIGFLDLRLIYVAAKLRLADLLKVGPRTVDELAAVAGVQTQPWRVSVFLLRLRTVGSS